MRYNILSSKLTNCHYKGSRPRVWAKQEINRPEFNLVNEDIQGSGPRMLHIGLNKPEYNLSNEDIEGTKAQIFKFVTKREPSNPLNPVYKLPSFTIVPPEVPRFIRDGMQIDDIEGSKPILKKKFAPRDTLNCFDI